MGLYGWIYIGLGLINCKFSLLCQPISLICFLNLSTSPTLLPPLQTYFRAKHVTLLSHFSYPIQAIALQQLFTIQIVHKFCKPQEVSYPHVSGTLPFSRSSNELIGFNYSSNPPSRICHTLRGAQLMVGYYVLFVREIEKSLKGKVKNKTPFTPQETCLYNLRHVFTQKQEWS